MRMELALRPDYGAIAPWIELAPDGAVATAGPDGFRLSTPLAAAFRGRHVEADFEADRGGPGTVRADLAPLIRADPAGRGRRLGARPHRGLVAGVERPLHLRRPVSR